MLLPTEIIDKLVVSPGKKFKLKDCDSAWIPKQLQDLDADDAKEKAAAFLDQSRKEMSKAQELLYASDSYSVLVIFQAMDAAGKDGTIKHVMSGLNPQGCQVFSFKAPTAEELDHNFLWRCMKALPERGRIGIFNRSYYEEVLVVRVHPELVVKQRIPGAKVDMSFWKERYEDINAFERHLTRNGTIVLKFFLNVSKEEQKQRFLSRLNEEEKNWKFEAQDVVERGFWSDYMEAYGDALEETSTPWAPWYVIPADRKWLTRALVAGVISNTLQSLGLHYPEVSKEEKDALQVARAKLETEK